MALTLAAMRSQLGSLLGYDLDNFHGENPTASQLTDQLNYALRVISEEICQFHPRITLTLTAGTNEYDVRDVTSPAVVSRKVIEPKQVIINGNMLWAAGRQKYGVWTLEELERLRPEWDQEADGTPNVAAFHDRTLYLVPAPTSAVVSAGSNYIAGRYLAADMVNVTDDNAYPDIPEELHEAIVRLAAVFAADPNVTETEGLARLGRYEQRAYAAIAKVKARNMKTISGWGTTRGYRRPNFIAG